MKMQWLARAGRSRLMVFFAGWGMDGRPFDFLAAGESDVLLFFDYTETCSPIDLGAVCGAYRTVDIVAWSLGVAEANRMCAGLRPAPRNRVAVNGTILPIHDTCGIPSELFDATAANLARGGVERFRRRMCGDARTLARFGARLPARDEASLRDELLALRTRWATPPPVENVFDCAWVGKRDRIVPAESQVRCWEQFGVPFTVLDEPHFPFYRWSSWEEMVCRNRA